MAAYVKTLYDSTQTNILYPQTKAVAVYLNDNSNLQSTIEEIYSLLNGGGIQIIVSSTQPTNQNAGDFWYQIVN